MPSNMKRKKRKTKIRPKSRHTPTKKKESKLLHLPLLLRKAILFIAVLSLLILLARYNAGYQWLYKNLVVDNIRKTSKYMHKSKEEKLELKLGFSAKYMNFLKEKTGEDALILMPPDSAFYPKGEKSPFSEFIARRTWGHYFIYPRKLLLYKERDSFPELYKKLTHIAVVNYWGYHFFPNIKGKKQKYSIITLNNGKLNK